MSASRRSPLTCPRCGATMNHHAEKLVVTAAPDPALDPDLGGYIQELHSCPRCGHLESRR
jgi:ribosomal protein S27AE